MPTPTESHDVCVIGAGPAGSVMAVRLAQLGFSVCLIERAAFPRRRIGESLSPGVLPLLETIGARAAVESAGFTPVRSVWSNWEGAWHERVDPREQGLLVDRGRFDGLLIDRARASGVEVLHPAAVRDRVPCDDGWTLTIEAANTTRQLRVRFVVDACGRAATLAGHRRQTGPRTLALYAYWKGSTLPTQPRIEAGPQAWYWGVPTPDGLYNTQVFIDGERLRDQPASSRGAHFRALLAESSLMDACADARIVGSVRAADATPYVDAASVTPTSLKVGDAALAIDPLSSSGVQKAIQTSLSGAIVVNTLLRRPALTEAAMRFYADSLTSASERHCRWAAEHYATVSAREPHQYWSQRSAAGSSRLPPPASRLPVSDPRFPTHAEITARMASALPIGLSPTAAVIDVPVLGSEFVELGAALHHPGLDAPVAFLGGWELAPLLRQVRSGMTPLQVVRAWSPRVPFESGVAIAGWLLGHDILVSHASASMGTG